MNKEEIESRILICEIKEREYREVGNTKSANRYSNEIKKWEKLLEQLDSNNYDELLTYKKGYNNLKQALNEIRKYIKGAYEMAIYTKNICLAEENFRNNR